MNDVFSRAVVRNTEGKVLNPRSPLTPILGYVLASAIGGTLTGAALGAFGWLAQPAHRQAWLWSLLGLAVMAVLLQWRGAFRPLLQRRRQVPRRWLLSPSRLPTALAFGLVIGAGALTYLQFATTYVLAVLVVLTENTFAGAALGAVYGLVRGLPLLVTWAAETYRGARPDWEVLLRYRGALNRTLATTAAMTLAVAVNVHPVM
jgi:hypothetical protein